MRLGRKGFGWFILGMGLFLCGGVEISRADTFAAKCPKSEKPLSCFAITKLISKEDVSTLQRLLTAKRSDSVMILLNSEGGDVDAAIALGRLLRSNLASAWVREPWSCLSSCVFVFAGATIRLADGKIGIHRPYISDTLNRSFAQIQRSQAVLAKRAKDYLVEVNVLPQLFDEMMTTSPENIRILTYDEQKRFGLGPVDPVRQEMEDAKGAREYGITKEEYLRRKGIAAEICTRFYSDLSQIYDKEIGQRYFACTEEVMRSGRSP